MAVPVEPGAHQGPALIQFGAAKAGYHVLQSTTAAMNTTRSLLCAAVAALVSLASVTAQNLGVAFDPNVDGYLEVPYSPQVVPQSGITVEAWITYDDAALPTGWRYPTIVRQGISVGGSENYFLRVNAGNTGLRQLRWKVVTTTGSPTVDWTFAAGQLTTWTHVAATYNGANAVLYVNGMQVGSAVGNGPIRDTGNEVLRIGKGSDVSTPIEVWNGELDEVRLWPFARTQAEIQSTLNQELSAVPGRVSTWNMSGTWLDTSGTLHATSGGQVTPTVNPLMLSAPALSAIGVGASTAGCLGPLALAPGSLPMFGNTAFGVVCTPNPANSIGVFGVSFGVIPAPFPLLGVDIWLDPATVYIYTEFANSLGALRVGLPLTPIFSAGFAFAVQALVLDACGPADFTASDALILIVQP